MTDSAPKRITRSSKKKIPTIKTMTDTIAIKINEWITALFASSNLEAPTYLDISEFAPAPTPLPRPMMTRYNGVMKPKAASASALMPETQKLSIKLFRNIRNIERIVGKASLFMAFLGLPVIDSMLSLVCIDNIFQKGSIYLYPKNDSRYFFWSCSSYCTSDILIHRIFLFSNWSKSHFHTRKACTLTDTQC